MLLSLLRKYSVRPTVLASILAGIRAFTYLDLSFKTLDGLLRAPRSSRLPYFTTLSRLRYAASYLLRYFTLYYSLADP